MELTKPVLWIAGLLFGLVIVVVSAIRARALNTHDPLQERLADHLRDYFRSGRTEETRALAVERLRGELRQRQVPRDEWRHRLLAATRLLESPKGQDGADTLATAKDVIGIIERLGKSS